MRELRSSVVAGIIIGLLSAIAGTLGAYYEHRLGSQTVWPAIGLFFGPPVAMFLAVGITVLLEIRVSASRVQQVFLGRYILSDYAVADFQEIFLHRRGCAAVLYFCHGERIHFFGAHPNEITRLFADLYSSLGQRTAHHAIS